MNISPYGHDVIPVSCISEKPRIVSFVTSGHLTRPSHNSVVIIKIDVAKAQGTDWEVAIPDVIV